MCICEHNRERTQCKECGGVSICEHNRQRTQCKECGSRAICEHNCHRTKCNICNNNHLQHGVTDLIGSRGNRHGSKWEHQFLNVLEAILPFWWICTEQWPVQSMDPVGRDLHLDMEVIVREDGVEGACIVETDGGQHHDERSSDHFEPGSHPQQLARDRYTEDYALSRLRSVFSVPDSIKNDKQKVAWAADYIKRNAIADIRACVARVHYLDYERTYSNIPGLDVRVRVATEGVFTRTLTN